MQRPQPARVSKVVRGGVSVREPAVAGPNQGSVLWGLDRHQTLKSSSLKSRASDRLNIQPGDLNHHTSAWSVTESTITWETGL